MGMIELNRKRAAVIGLGQSGLAMARWLARSGSDVLVFDDRAQPPGLDALHAQVPGATFHSRTLDAGVLDAAGQIDLLAWSPGVSCETGAGAALHAAARERGIPVHGELDFFMDAIATLRAQGAKTDVVAITGTNGKTTVTRLCAFLANEAGLEAVAAGNISPSMLDALMDRLGDLPIEPVPAPLQESAPEDESAPESLPPSAAAAAMPRLWALELSSFQLAVSQPPVCQAAVVLNVTPDHLDWHGSMENYRAAKLRIYPAAERRVVNLDDPLADPDLPAPWEVPAEPEAPQPAKGRSRAKAKVEVPVLAPRTDFSLHTPHSAPAFGLVREGGLAWLTEALPEEVPGGRRRKAEPVDFVLNRLMPADALRVQGAHNHANVLAALALLRACDVPMRAMLHALRAFVTDHHRCEPVTVVNGIEYIDDSKGTNIGATVAALQGLGRRAVLIAGGVGKDQDFSLLAPAVAHRSCVLRWQTPALRWKTLPTWMPPCAPVHALRRRVMWCCCRRPAPASTCSGATTTGARSLPRPCAPWPRRQVNHAESPGCIAGLCLAGRRGCRCAQARNRCARTPCAGGRQPRAHAAHAGQQQRAAL